MPVPSVQHIVPHACDPVVGAWGCAHQVQHDIMNKGNDLPQFVRASPNIAATAMLLRDVPEHVDPQERVVYQNLQVLVEATSI